MPNRMTQYPRDWVRPDLVAGLTTAAVVIPDATAYATVTEAASDGVTSMRSQAVGYPPSQSRIGIPTRRGYSGRGPSSLGMPAGSR
jgi:hypothetical protein